MLTFSSKRYAKWKRIIGHSTWDLLYMYLHIGQETSQLVFIAKEMYLTILHDLAFGNQSTRQKWSVSVRIRGMRGNYSWSDMSPARQEYHLLCRAKSLVDQMLTETWYIWDKCGVGRWNCALKISKSSICADIDCEEWANGYVHTIHSMVLILANPYCECRHTWFGGWEKSRAAIWFVRDLNDWDVLANDWPNVSMNYHSLIVERGNDSRYEYWSGCFDGERLTSRSLNILE